DAPRQRARAGEPRAAGARRSDRRDERDALSERPPESGEGLRADESRRGEGRRVGAGRGRRLVEEGLFVTALRGKAALLLAAFAGVLFACPKGIKTEERLPPPPPLDRGNVDDGPISRV